MSKKLVGIGVSQELSQLVAECLSVRREEVRAQRSGTAAASLTATSLKVSTCTLPQLALYCEPVKKAGEHFVLIH